METSKHVHSGRFSFLRLQNQCGWWQQPWNEKMLPSHKESYDNIDGILRRKDITLLTKVHIVMYGCESWTIKKAEHQRIDAIGLWCWRRLLRVPWTARRLNQLILKESNPEYSLEGLMLKLQYYSHLMQRADSLEKTLMLGKTRAGGEGDGRGWDGWIVWI